MFPTVTAVCKRRLIRPLTDQNRIPPPKAVCPDLLIGVKSMAYVMRYNHFPD